MPETPDFHSIARQTLGASFANGRTAEALAICDAFAEQLRLIWNARGAADRAAVKRDLLGTCADTSHSDPDNSGQCITCGVVLDYLEPRQRADQLERALRTLDR